MRSYRYILHYLCLLLRLATQFGLLPYLEIKSAEITISGNATIARYLAEKYGELMHPACCDGLQAVAKQYTATTVLQ